MSLPAACGGSDDNTSGAAPATTTASTTRSTRPAGKAGILAALDKVSANVAALKTNAKSQRSSQITEVDGALEGLKATVSGINGDNVLSAVPTIVNDLKRIDASWSALQRQIDQRTAASQHEVAVASKSCANSECFWQRLDARGFENLR